MKDSHKTETRFGRRAIAAILRHHRHKAMFRYLQYLKSDSQPISEEERQTYRPPLKHWWFNQAEAGKKSKG